MKKRIIDFLIRAGALIGCSLLFAGAAYASAFIVPQGGTGQQTFPVGALLVGNGTSAISNSENSPVHLATTTTSNLNGVIVVDGIHYAQTAAGITSAIASASASNATSTVLIPSGTINIASGSFITPLSNVTVRCEGTVLARNTSSAYSIWRATNGLTNFTLTGCTHTGGSAWYSSGNVASSTFTNNKFYGDPSVSSFLVFFDAFQPNPDNTITYNLFSGSTGSGNWDMLGSGKLDYGTVAFNKFENGNGQGWGATTMSYMRVIGNKFYNVGNAIGFEGTTTGNIVEDNFVWNSGNIKLALVGGSDVSYGNTVSGNHLFYSGGIEDGLGYGDLITNNIIYRSAQKGIFGTFDRATIANNQLIETNYTNSAITVGGVLQTDGGIVLLNDARDATPSGNTISNNKLYTSRNSFTIPSGSTDSGWTGGILIDSTYANTQLNENTEDNTYDTVKNYGTGSSILSALNGVWNFTSSAIASGAITSYTSLIAPFVNATSTTATSTFSGNIVANGGINLSYGLLNGQTTGIKTSRYLELGETNFGALPYIAFNANLSSSSPASSYNGFTPTYTGSGASSMILYADAGQGNLHFISRSVAGVSGESSAATFGEVFRMSADGSFLVASTTATSTFSGALTVGTSKLVVNNFNSNIGVSTSSPGSLLSIGNTNGINFSTATSTFSSTGGINLASGCFSVNGTCLTNATAYTGTYPIQITGSVISTALSTTTTNVFSALNTFNGGLTVSGAITLGSLNGLLYGNSGVVNATATTTPTLGLGLAYSGTLGSFVGGATGQFTIATSSLYSGTSGQFPYFSNTNTITATSSLFMATNGFVGVGTTSPYANLSVMAGSDYSSHAISTIFAVGSSTAGTATSTLFSVTSQGAIKILGNNSIFGTVGTAQTTATDRVYINSDSSNSGYGGLEIRQNGGNAQGLLVHSGDNVQGVSLVKFNDQNGSDTGTVVEIANSGSGTSLLVDTGTTTTPHLSLSALRTSTTGNAVCINATGNEVVTAGAITCATSSKYTKYDIRTMDGKEAMKEVMALQPVLFDYIDGDRKNVDGVIAEQAALVAPGIVTYAATTTIVDGHTFLAGDPYAVDPNAEAGLLFKAIQYEQSEIFAKAGMAAGSVEENWQWLAIGILALWSGVLTVIVFKRRK